MAKPPKKTQSGRKDTKASSNRGGREAARGGKHHSSAAKKQEKPRFSSGPHAQKSENTQKPLKPQKPQRGTPSSSRNRERTASGSPENKQPRIKADLFGAHAVREAWKNPSRFVHALYITETALRDFEADLKTEAKRPAPTIVTKEELDRAFPAGTVHQGIALAAQPLEERNVMDLIIQAENKEKSVIVILDQVTDPHNVGAIMRSACAFGADGIVMQSRHAPEATGILAKTACGAVEHLPVAYETNLSRAMEKLKEHHYTIIGMDEHAAQGFNDLPSYERAVIVLGAEGPGMRRLIREHCDILVTLPTKRPINSLNVSNAAAVALYALLS
ncbi:MAG: 23S rRNA (guanosine(2251)-2'-O)-methyltransferase RlmB [Micavibrio sp.]